MSYDSENQARWDAETLAQAKEIEMDPGRVEKAKIAAKKLAAQEDKRAQAMRKVAGKDKRQNKGDTERNTPNNPMVLDIGAPTPVPDGGSLGIGRGVGGTGRGFGLTGNPPGRGMGAGQGPGKGFNVFGKV